MNVRELQDFDQPDWLRQYKCYDCLCEWEEH